MTRLRKRGRLAFLFSLPEEDTGRGNGNVGSALMKGRYGESDFPREQGMGGETRATPKWYVPLQSTVEEKGGLAADVLTGFAPRPP